MTVLESRPDTADVQPDEAPAVADAKPTAPRSSRQGTTAIAIIALVALIAGWALFELFEGPIAQSWYRARSHQLSAQIQAKRPHNAVGDAMAVLQAPNVNMNVVVTEGDTPQQLRSGPGHRIGTPVPGDIGNSVIVGHRIAWGGPFRALGDLQTGQALVVYEVNQGRYAFFKIVSVQRVAADDPAPFAQTTDRRLTIVTGAGGQFSDRRLVITAVSGKVGKVLPGKPATATGATSSGSRLWNSSMLLAVVGFGAGCLIAFALRRRYRPAVVAAVTVPLFVLGLLGLFMNLDLFLPPLR